MENITKAESKYIDWLKKRDSPLFTGAGTCWTLYNGALITASPAPNYPDVESSEASLLLKQSKAWFLRYASEPSDSETAWWYVVCDRYDPSGISAKTRQNVKRGQRECSIREVEAKWLADQGYECYAAAFGRYEDQKPISRDVFRTNILATTDGPFVYWGVFHGANLAGYCQVIVDGDNAITNVTKYHPEYLRHRTAYALMNELIQRYVLEKGMVLSNGSRSISHNTNYQEVLISMGFQKKFCRLNIIYNPWLRIGIKTLYPMRSLVYMIPDKNVIHKVRAILHQEEIRRSSSA